MASAGPPPDPRHAASRHELVVYFTTSVEVEDPSPAAAPTSPPPLTMALLASLFESHGELSACRLISNRPSQQKTGIVTYEHAASAAQAAAALNGLVRGHHVLRVRTIFLVCWSGLLFLVAISRTDGEETRHWLGMWFDFPLLVLFFSCLLPWWGIDVNRR